MHINIPGHILALKGQRVKDIILNQENSTIEISCSRDRRKKAIDPKTGQAGRINQYIKRQVIDLPLIGYKCLIEIELAQVFINRQERRIEGCDFVDKGNFYTLRFCRLISGLCRYMSISIVAKHFDLRWETVKNMDRTYLEKTLPALDPSQLLNLKYIGVDEVAKAKGHDYMTVIYNLETGVLIGVETGRTSDVFTSFIKKLPEETKLQIKAVAMDMGISYQSAVKKELPNVDIVFDRFHVMQNFSKAIKNQRRVEFRKADNKGKDLIKGSLYLLLRNRENLTEKQDGRLSELLAVNKNLSQLYLLKEQLRTLWDALTYEEMESRLNQWCEMADQTEMVYMRKYAKMLRSHYVGICNYAKYQLTTARIEAGNIAIGMIRKRARGINDTEYFKLKIRQTSQPDERSMFYYAGEI